MSPQHRNLPADKGYDLRRFTSGAHVPTTPMQNGRDNGAQNEGGHFIPRLGRVEKTSSSQGINPQESLRNTRNIGSTRKLQGFDFKSARRKATNLTKRNNYNTLKSNAIVPDTSISSLMCPTDRLAPDKGSLPVLQLMGPDLWAKFHEQQNEMIITKSGRCLFPCLVFEAANLDPDSIYIIRLDFEKLDPHRLRFSNSRWTPALSPKRSDDSSSDNESMVTEILAQESYTHPDLCQTGAYWMSRQISFAKVKLSNNFSISDISGGKGGSHKKGDIGDSSHLFHIKSFHRYRPRLHLILCSQQTQAMVTSETFIFDSTAFIAVTHYQNYKVNDLKKSFNPHAKGFRGTIGKPYTSLRTGSRRIRPSGYARDARRSKRFRNDTDSTGGEINWSEDENNDSGEDKSSGVSEISGRSVDDGPRKECSDAVEDDNSMEVSYKHRHPCRTDKINKSMVTISLPKDSHSEVKMSERSPGRRQAINGTIRDESSSLCAAGVTAMARNHNQVYKPAHTKLPFSATEEKSDLLNNPLIATNEFNRLQGTLAGMAPKLSNQTCGQADRQINTTPASLLQIPTQFSSIPLSTRQPSFVLDRISSPVPAVDQTNSTTIISTLATTPTLSWYEQFSFRDQASLSLPPSHPPAFDAPTKDSTYRALQPSLQQATGQNTLVPEIMNSPGSQPVPPQQQHRHQQPVQPTPPLSLLSEPFMDVEYHDMQGIHVLDDAPLPGSREADQTHLEPLLQENLCLKAFIRERYGREAEADANAVVAMQCFR
ncbi:hypothetical protein EDD21DRAFT_414495 [Dissophora ornata]|nr:hypothetical protein EDD21DRAFT_414495 [Dissophora ornata]